MMTTLAWLALTTYELGIVDYDSQVFWIDGPFKAGESDINIFCKGLGLVHAVVVRSPSKKKSNNYNGTMAAALAVPRNNDIFFDQRVERRLLLSKSLFCEGRVASLQLFVKIPPVVPVVVSVRTRSFVS